MHAVGLRYRYAADANVLPRSARENAALSGDECRVPALRERRTRHSKRTPLRGPLSAALCMDFNK